MSGQALILNGITHRYGASVAVDNVTLDIKGGEVAVLRALASVQQAARDLFNGEANIGLYRLEYQC